MNNNKCIIFLTLLVLLAVTTFALSEEQSVSESLSAIRSIREAEFKRKNKKKINANQRYNKRKYRMKKKNNKVRKNKRKNLRKKKVQASMNRSRIMGRSVDGKCLESATTIMRRWKDVVANFEKQKTRVEKQANIASKKSLKKGAFDPIAKKLIDIGGGNKTGLTCAGSSTSAGAQQLTNLTTTLMECVKEVNKTCDPANFPKPNMTLINECSNHTKSFKEESQKCLGLSKEDTAVDACTCWTSNAMATLSEAVKNCKIAELGDISKGLKNCTGAFSKCRKYEDAAVAAISACSQDVNKLKEKAETLTKNKDGLNNVKSKISQVTGTSSRAAANSCGDFIALVTLGKQHGINIPAFHLYYHFQ